MEQLLKIAATFAGIGGVGAIVLLLIYNKWLSLPIFQKMTKSQQFTLFLLVIVLTFFFGLAAIYAYVQVNHNPPTGDTRRNEGSVVFGQIEISTHDCAWEPMSRPIHVVAPIRSISGQYWKIGGPPLGLPPQRKWAMGSHHLFPLGEAAKNDSLDVDPIFDVALVNKGPGTVVISRIGIRPIAAWTSPKGPPFSGRIVNFDSYSLEMDGFEPGKDQFLVLKEPVSLVPNDPYRFKLRLSGYCRHAPRNETVIQLIVEADQKVIASDDIFWVCSRFQKFKRCMRFLVQARFGSNSISSG